MRVVDQIVASIVSSSCIPTASGGHELERELRCHLEDVIDEVRRSGWSGSNYKPNGNPMYDGDGNLLGFQDMVMGGWNFTYDTPNRLVTGSNAGSNSYDCWTYDAFGNRTLEASSNRPFAVGSPASYGPCQPQANNSAGVPIYCCKNQKILILNLAILPLPLWRMRVDEGHIEGIWGHSACSDLRGRAHQLENSRAHAA